VVARRMEWHNFCVINEYNCEPKVGHQKMVMTNKGVGLTPMGNNWQIFFYQHTKLMSQSIEGRELMCHFDKNSYEPLRSE
jgi:hypothetical protein